MKNPLKARPWSIATLPLKKKKEKIMKLVKFRMPVLVQKDFVPVDGTWSAEFDSETETCWDAEAALAEAIGREVGFAVEVQIFHENGYEILDNANEVNSGSMLVTYSGAKHFVSKADQDHLKALPLWPWPHQNDGGPANVELAWEVKNEPPLSTHENIPTKPSKEVPVSSILSRAVIDSARLKPR